MLFVMTAAAATMSTSHVAAEDEWKPFAGRDAAKSRTRPARTQDDRPYLPPFEQLPSRPPGGTRPTELAPNGGYGYTPPPITTPATPGPGFTRPPDAGESPSEGGAGYSRVDRGELAPVTVGEGAALPAGTWQGLELATIEQLITPLELPNGSYQLNLLWKQILAAPVSRTDMRLQALKAEANYRSGQIAKARNLLAGPPQPATQNDGLEPAILAGLKARILLATGAADEGCRFAKQAATDTKRLPRALRGEIIAIAGYCAIRAGNRSAGPLAAGLARREGYANARVLSLLEAIGEAREPSASYTQAIGVLDALLLKQAGLTLEAGAIEVASPPLLAMLAGGDEFGTTARIAAAEEAARRNIIGTEDLAKAYRAHTFSRAERESALGAATSPELRRALMFQLASTDRTPFRRTRLLRALLDDARRHDLTSPLLRLIKPLVDDLPRKQEIGWFAETAIESALVAGDQDSALAWTIFSAALDRNADGTLQHWRTLIGIAHRNKPASGARDDLSHLESLVAKGRLPQDMLHRLATVLDALDYNVPIPLWEAASRTPQPKTGHLPPTGVLSQLQDASKKGQIARTVLLCLRTVGPGGARGAHMIALGDTIRALKRSGLEDAARRLAFEALFDQWPRTRP